MNSLNSLILEGVVKETPRKDCDRDIGIIEFVRIFRDWNNDLEKEIVEVTVSFPELVKKGEAVRVVGRLVNLYGSIGIWADYVEKGK